MTKDDMKRSMDVFVARCVHFGLTTNTDRTVVMHRQLPNAEYDSPWIILSGKQHQTGENFAHLGSLLSRCTSIENEVARQTFGQSQAPVWHRHVLELNSKLEMHKAVVFTTERRPGRKPCQEAQPHLSSQNTKAKMARHDLGHGKPRTDPNPQPPRHAEVNAFVKGRHLVRMDDN
ncbi:hypothetical protein SprV_0702282900 [Sparganum proliferum]